MTTATQPLREPEDPPGTPGRGGLIGVAARLVAVGFSLYHLYVAGFGGMEAHRHRIIHLSLAVALTLLVHPDAARLPRAVRYALNGALGLCFVASLGYLLGDYNYLVASRFQFVTPVSVGQLVLGVVFVVGILELCRRLTGWVLPAIVLVALVYPFVGGLPGLLRHNGFDLAAVVDAQYLTTIGTFGVPLGASADYIALFVIFGAFLQRSGLAAFIIDLASGLTGRSRGGPAKVSVVASAMTGTISGSAPANVLTTGTMTIPLMKRIGYPSHFAGAVEAAASTGGVLMPPVMGSIAFIMSQYTGIPYSRIMLYALVPAVLYFFGLLLTVHWSALRHGVAGVDKADLPSWRRTLTERGHLLLPIVLLVTLIALGYTPQFAVFYSIISVVVVAAVRSETRMRIRDIVIALENGAKAALMIALATAAAGMIVGVFDLTGVSAQFAQGAADLVDNLFLALVLTAVVSLVLGLGIPPSASYVVQVAITIPVLIGFVGMSGMEGETALVVSHFFVMYYAALAVLTPPDALAAVAAAGIARTSFLRTAITGTRVAFAAFIVPFVAVYRPGVLLLGSVTDIVLGIAVAVGAVFTLSVALEGHFLRPLTLLPRMLMLAAGVALAIPAPVLDVLGLAGAVAVCGHQLWSRREPDVSEARPGPRQSSRP